MIIIGIILFLSVTIWIYLKVTKVKQEIEKKENRIFELNKTYESLTTKFKELEDAYANINNKISEANKKYLDEVDSLNNILLEKKDVQDNFTACVQRLNNDLETKEKEHSITVAALKEEQINLEAELNKLKSTLSAGNQAILKEREKELDIDFYKLPLSGVEERDIELLKEVEQKITNSTVVSKIIWSAYFQKETTALCNRILGNEQVTGIYKITNLKTKEVYVGQGVSLSDRWKQHVKCGLGIDTPSSNKLYKSMQKYGVWNFTFELLEKCEKNELNEKEAKWIEMYQSNIYGLNTTKGVLK